MIEDKLFSARLKKANKALDKHVFKGVVITAERGWCMLHQTDLVWHFSFRIGKRLGKGEFHVHFASESDRQTGVSMWLS